MVRKGKVGDLLYEDAKKRNEKKRESILEAEKQKSLIYGKP